MIKEDARVDNTPLNHLIKEKGENTTSIKDILDTHFKTHRPKEENPNLAEWNEEVKREIESHSSTLNPLEYLTEEIGDEDIRNHFRFKKVQDEIKRLKINSAAGDDNISNRLLKEVPDEVVKAIWRIFNLCISIGH